MSYWLLTKTGSVISRTTVQRVTNLKLQTSDVKTKCNEFDADTSRQLKDEDFPLEGSKPNPEDWAEFINHDSDFQEEFNRIFSSEEIPEADETFTPDMYDETYLRMDLALPINGDHPEFAKVTKRLKDSNGLTIGTANQNPILDTRMYKVEYQDGHRAYMTANSITQHLFAQVDEEGHIQVLFYEIIDHSTDGKELKQQGEFVTTKSVTQRRRETTEGW